MSTFGPSVDDAVSGREVEDGELQAVAAVPVPVLYGEAQAAMACGDWADACELLREVVRLEPGFAQDGGSARQLLAQARRAHALATRRKPIVGVWPVLISVAVVILIPFATGLAMLALGTPPVPNVGAPLEPLQLADAPPVPTAVPPPPTVAVRVPTVAPAVPMVVPALATVAPVLPRPTAAPAAAVPAPATTPPAAATIPPAPAATPPAPAATPPARPAAPALGLARVPTPADLWQAQLAALEGTWGTDWPAAIRDLDTFSGQYPGFAPAEDKLYAALVEYGKDLLQRGDAGNAVAQLSRAQALAPDRPDAAGVLESLTPAPRATPATETVVEATPAPETVVRATPAPETVVRATPAPETVERATEVPATDVAVPTAAAEEVVIREPPAKQNVTR